MMLLINEFCWIEHNNQLKQSQQIKEVAIGFFKEKENNKSTN